MKIINKKGVTLIEIMVVMAIIGILISISYPSWNYIVKKARSSEAKVNLALVASSQHRYKAHCKTFHPDFGLTGAIPSGTIHYDVRVVHGSSTKWKTCGNKEKAVCGSNCRSGFHESSGARGVCPNNSLCNTQKTQHYMPGHVNFKSDVIGRHYGKCYRTGTPPTAWASNTITITEKDFCLFAASALKGANNFSGYSIWMMSKNRVLEEIQ